MNSSFFTLLSVRGKKRQKERVIKKKAAETSSPLFFFFFFFYSTKQNVTHSRTASQSKPTKTVSRSRAEVEGS
jgi:hypothetical protein